MARLIISGWGDFQHYSKRNPPWIKLHKKLLDNFEFHCLPDASKALAPFLWLLASESDDGSIDFQPKKIAFRLHMTEGQLIDALKPLIAGGFVSSEQDASTALAPCTQDATLETERETESETEAETETEIRAPSRAPDFAIEFDQFYDAYPLKADRAKAFSAYRKARKKTDAATLLDAAGRYRDDPKRDPSFTKYPASWLNAESWLNQPSHDPPRKSKTMQALDDLALRLNDEPVVARETSGAALPVRTDGTSNGGTAGQGFAGQLPAGTA